MPFRIERNDIALVDADAIVCPANPQLRDDGGGACGAIFRHAGARRMRRALRATRHCEPGQTVVTPGFKLPARYVIHAVGPVWHGGAFGEPDVLRSAYRNALLEASLLEVSSVAVPLISTGNFGYPLREAFDIALDEIRTFLGEHELTVILVLYSSEAMQLGQARFSDITSYISDRYVREWGAWARHDRAAGNVVADDSGTPDARDEMPYALGEASAALDIPEPYGASPIPDGFEFPDTAGRYDALPLPEDTGGLEALGMPEDIAWPDLAGEYVGSATPEDVEAGPGGIELVPDDLGPAPDIIGEAPRQPASSSTPAHVPDVTTPTHRDLNRLLQTLDASFSETLLRLIDERGLSDAEAYKRANVSRQLFSKIRSKPGYRPSKQTVLAFAIALELSPAETDELLKRAGFALSHSNKADIIVEYFITHRIYDIFTVNEALFAFDQPLLGSL